MTSTIVILPSIIEESDEDLRSTKGIEDGNGVNRKSDFEDHSSNKSNDYDEGYKNPGWFTVLSTFLVLFYTFGIIFSFGNFQKLYVEEVYRDQVNAFEIMFIGGLASALLVSSGLYIPLLTNRWGYKIIMLLGTVVCPLGLILSSMCTMVYQIFICQGVIFGIGAGLIFSTTVVLPSPWFYRHRCLALGISFSGAGFGPVLFGPVTSLWNLQIGYRQCLRVLGGIGFFILGMATLLVKIHPSLSSSSTVPVISPSSFTSPITKIELTPELLSSSSYTPSTLPIGFPLSSSSSPSSSTSIMTKPFFKKWNGWNPHYLLLLFYSLLVTFGYLYPYFALPTYAKDILYMNDTNGSLLISLMSLLNGISRIFMGFIGDRIGALNALLICTFISGLSSSLIWQFSSNFGIYIIYCIVIGFFSGTFTSLLPIIVSDIINQEAYQKYVGICYAVSKIKYILL
ncbi:major facilitator superfamily domain-containing protein [Cunninghamella echinulata]|nr:major facilitator superfamily domain-containing protein [Cunninghamella echinulata]